MSIIDVVLQYLLILVSISTSLAWQGHFGFFPLCACLWHVMYNIAVRPKGATLFLELASGLAIPVHFISLALVMYVERAYTIDPAGSYAFPPAPWSAAVDAELRTELRQAAQNNSDYLRVFVESVVVCDVCDDQSDPRRALTIPELEQLSSAVLANSSTLYANSGVPFLVNAMSAGTIQWHCPWSYTDALYFTATTMSTVGYGDLTPGLNQQAYFTTLFALTGILAFAVVSKLGIEWMGIIIRMLSSMLVNTNRGGQLKAYVDAHWKPSAELELGARAYILCISFFALHLVFAHVFTLLEDWRMITAFYHCVTTALTIGYGDVTIATQEGRRWATLHIFVSVMFFSEVVGVRTIPLRK